MDILLTHGYYLYEDPHELAVMKPYAPLGLLYISSHLKSRGFDVRIFDSTFSSRAAFRQFVLEHRPPVVGFYCNLMTRPNVVSAMGVCKEAGSLVVVGGPEPANYPEEYLRRGADVVVIGEGERTLEELLPHLARHGAVDMEEIAGIAYRGRDGDILRTAPRPNIRNLDEQPFPDRAAIDVDEYLRIWRKHHGAGSVSLITARGCPYTCTWCSHAVFGYTHRRRSPINVADELQLILETYQPEQVWYADDVFTIHHRWLQTYADELDRRGIRAPFETISREDRLNEDVVRALARMGCYRIWIGAESGSQRILDAMKRRTNAARVREMVALLQRYGIQAGLFIMLGFEGEEHSDMQQTLEHLKAANADVFLTTVAYPIKGTPYYEQVADRVITRSPWETGSDRDFGVAGRHSRRYYEFANRWLVSEVALHRERQRPQPALRRLAKAFVSSQVGQIGMKLTSRESERASPLDPAPAPAK